MSEKNRTHRVRIFMLALSTVLVVAGCKDSAVQSVPSVAVPAAPKHYYAMKDGDAYGYEMAISAADRSTGQVATKLMMYSYLGRKGQTLQVMHQANKFNRLVAECTLPCQFVKVYSFIGDELTSKETIKLQPGTLLSFVFEDAANGQLEQFLGEQRGKKITFWVDGAAERLKVAAVETSDVLK